MNERRGGGNIHDKHDKDVVHKEQNSNDTFFETIRTMTTTTTTTTTKQIEKKEMKHEKYESKDQNHESQ